MMQMAREPSSEVGGPGGNFVESVSDEAHFQMAQANGPLASRARHLAIGVQPGLDGVRSRNSAHDGAAPSTSTVPESTYGKRTERVHKIRTLDHHEW